MTMAAIIKSLIVVKHEDGIEFVEMNNISSLLDEFEEIETMALNALETMDLGFYELTLNGNEVTCVKKKARKILI